MTALSDAPPENPPAVAPRAPDRHRWLLIGAGVVVAVGGLGLYFLCRSDMWLDEALSVNIARLPLSDLREALRHDGAPPLYYVLLHVWTGLFGTSDLAARSLSGCCMVAAVVVTWFAARRFAGRQVAWLSALVMLANPYAIRYATEARMYALEVLLVAAGILAFQRMVESPTLGRAAVFGVLVALAIYTQYWMLYLIAVVVGVLAWMVWRDVHRVAARKMLIATVIAGATFIPWVPTFLYQRAHTGTPWGGRIFPGLPLAYTLRDFAGGSLLGIDRQEGWLLFFVLTPMLLLGAFARPTDGRHMEIDLRTQRIARPIAFVGTATLVVALSLTYISGETFQTRYSGLVLPFYVLLVARGLSTLLDRRILAVVCSLVVVLGFGAGVRNAVTQRTQAGEVAAVLRADAHPGDLVVYCPDQVAPGVHRLAQSGLREVVFPSFAGPERIDWVDYTQRVEHADVGVFARDALARAGDHTLWYVSAPGYVTHGSRCEALTALFAAARHRIGRTSSDPNVFEKPALEEYPAPSASR